jgi:predicted chitinase
MSARSRRPPSGVTVGGGDTLSSLAADHLGSPDRWREIYELNRAVVGPDPDRIAVGTTLAMPGASSTPLLDAAGLSSPEGTVTVGRGDTLSSIALDHLGSPGRWREIYELNREAVGPNPDRIAVGTTLRLPAAAAPVLASATSTPAVTPEVTQTAQTQTAQAQTTNDGLAAWVEPIALASATASAVAVCPAELRAYGAQNIPLLLRQAANARVTLPDQAAYILATAEHESGFGRPMYSRSQSLVEDHNPIQQGRDGVFRARDHVRGQQVSGRTHEEAEVAYWDSAYGGRLGNERGTTDGANYRGRGFAQLTGRTNYERMTQILNDQGFTYTLDGETYGGPGGTPIDLLAHPDHVNRVPEMAARILVEGSMRGTFTERSLGDYVNEQGTDFVGARRVINGQDDAQLIAGIARRYSAALRDSAVWAAVFMPINAPARA